ncbi:MAG: hypothetical protein HY363_03125 [Candidatus Aenigmarchaeota archaeon]|nr:hypothetical protein [Candidatus Aenigmarchaeota archaeon]
MENEQVSEGLTKQYAGFGIMLKAGSDLFWVVTDAILACAGGAQLPYNTFTGIGGCALTGVGGIALLYQGLGLQNKQEAHWSGYAISSTALIGSAVVKYAYGPQAESALDGILSYGSAAFDGVLGGYTTGSFLVALLSQKKQTKTMKTKQTPETLESKLMLGKEYVIQRKLDEAFKVYNNVLDDARELNYQRVINEANAHLFVAHVQHAISCSETGEKRLTKVYLASAEKYMLQLNETNIPTIKTLQWRELARLWKGFYKWLKEYKYPWAEKLREARTTTNST